MRQTSPLPVEEESMQPPKEGGKVRVSSNLCINHSFLKFPFPVNANNIKLLVFYRAVKQESMVEEPRDLKKI